MTRSLRWIVLWAALLPVHALAQQGTDEAASYAQSARRNHLCSAVRRTVEQAVREARGGAEVDLSTAVEALRRCVDAHGGMNVDRPARVSVEIGDPGDGTALAELGPELDRCTARALPVRVTVHVGANGRIARVTGETLEGHPSPRAVACIRRVLAHALFAARGHRYVLGVVLGSNVPRRECPNPDPYCGCQMECAPRIGRGSRDVP